MPETGCLHLVRNPVSQDSRVLKETRSIMGAGLCGSVEIAGFHEPGYPEAETLDGREVRRFRLATRQLPKDLLSQSVKYMEWYARLIRHYRRWPLRVIHCHDLAPLPIAVRLKRLTGARVIYDAHELETETVGNRGVRQRLARWVERQLVLNVDHMITVSPSIRDWYRQRFPNTPVTLVRNIPDAPEQPAAAEPLRAELGVPENALLFLYLGGLGRGRGIEIALEAFQDSRVSHHVLFMGDGPLREEVRAAGKRCGRIHYRPPVPPSEVLAHAAGADVGLCLIEDICLSYRYCLPNKLFESLLAGLPVLASDLPDQADLVRSRHAGWVVPNEPEEIAATLLRLVPGDVTTMRNGLAERTRDLRWTHEADAILAMYRELCSGD